ncbi:MAG: crosslink repair DNA glycosylase YcaQ family protein [Brevefilum sp.]|nr:crosslink repair DNA glycosylase YcaQ family protein [Brevefilum sp.]MDW7755980.1 crosslink repair DNA glycosylase YcaQ family protein [Brevefilum sp.]
MNKITKDAVRRSMLGAQGLLTGPEKPASKDDLLPIIRQMGYLQIDTIQAVRRSQFLVLWSRLGQIESNWLDEIYKEVSLFEYYAHALCYLPIEDYPIYRGMILYDERTGNGWKKWGDQNLKIIDEVRSIIEEKGPVTSSDFDSRTFFTGWGDIKKEKMALNRMFATGEVMVSHRDNFRRYFDLRERILPEWQDEDALDLNSARQALLLKAVRALGVAKEDWIAPYFYLLKTGIPQELTQLVDQGQLDQVAVEGWGQPAYIHPDNREMVESVIENDAAPTHSTFLSPFDPLVSDRERALDLFNFDYKMESFTPAKDRKYGYFCLPILYKGNLIGRLDPKTHRKDKKMAVKKIYLEPGVDLTQELIDTIKNTLVSFTNWHGMETIEINASDPPELQEALR